MPSDPSKSPPSNLDKEYPKLMWVGFGINPHHYDIVHLINKKIKNQRHAIWDEFELVGPILLKNPLDARWGLLPTLRWVGSWLLTYLISFFRQVERKFHIRIVHPSLLGTLLCFILPWQCKVCKKPNMSFLAPFQPCERWNKWRRFGYLWWVAWFHWIDLQWVGLLLLHVQQA